MWTCKEGIPLDGWALRAPRALRLLEEARAHVRAQPDEVSGVAVATSDLVRVREGVEGVALILEPRVERGGVGGEDRLDVQVAPDRVAQALECSALARIRHPDELVLVAHHDVREGVLRVAEDDLELTELPILLRASALDVAPEGRLHDVADHLVPELHVLLRAVPRHQPDADLERGEDDVVRAILVGPLEDPGAVAREEGVARGIPEGVHAGAGRPRIRREHLEHHLPVGAAQEELARLRDVLLAGLVLLGRLLVLVVVVLLVLPDRLLDLPGLVLLVLLDRLRGAPQGLGDVDLALIHGGEAVGREDDVEGDLPHDLVEGGGVVRVEGVVVGVVGVAEALELLEGDVEAHAVEPEGVEVDDLRGDDHAVRLDARLLAEVGVPRLGHGLVRRVLAPREELRIVEPRSDVEPLPRPGPLLCFSHLLAPRLVPADRDTSVGRGWCDAASRHGESDASVTLGEFLS